MRVMELRPVQAWFGVGEIESAVADIRHLPIAGRQRKGLTCQIQRFRTFNSGLATERCQHGGVLKRRARFLPVSSRQGWADQVAIVRYVRYSFAPRVRFPSIKSF